MVGRNGNTRKVKAEAKESTKRFKRRIYTFLASSESLVFHHQFLLLLT
jgi:hypothetical protein